MGEFWSVGDQRRTDAAYVEFLRRPSLSAGVYRLAAGEEDPQRPHNEDEIYFIVSGKARLRTATGSRPVQAGTVAFVAAHEPHRFEEIQEDLEVLVMFAPAETPS